ncbi:hypothetical protein [Nitrosomonas marina]|uniref:hypothetical protein n=1 Tax=Nitrosomonas marina TaxID=917 RepID=UPI0015A568E5|nr:hypothetical protein [Nitrosomonas marina]
MFGINIAHQSLANTPNKTTGLLIKQSIYKLRENTAHLVGNEKLHAGTIIYDCLGVSDSLRR